MIGIRDQVEGKNKSEAIKQKERIRAKRSSGRKG